jgi:hypothetical protein
VKRAILPAAISESAASRLLAEAGSREPPRRRRRGRSRKGPREMTIRNRTRLTLPPHPHSLCFMVPIAQLAERLSVEQEVTGSCPVRHPRKMAWLRGEWQGPANLAGPSSRAVHALSMTLFQEGSRACRFIASKRTSRRTRSRSSLALCRRSSSAAERSISKNG